MSQPDGLKGNSGNQYTTQVREIRRLGTTLDRF